MIPSSESSHSKKVRTNCRACLPACGVVVTVDAADHVLAVNGDKEHPRTEGYMCPKGPQIVWGHHRPDRLNHPAVDGRQVSWEEALDDLAARIKAAIEKNGPDGFGCHVGSGVDMLGVDLLFRLCAALGTQQVYSPLTMDVAPSYKAAELVTGYAGALLPHWELDDEAVKLLLVFGSNPVVSHGYAGAAALSGVSKRLRRFKSQGGKLWVFDPIWTRTAREADEHVAPIPGSDPAILAWLVKQVLENLPGDSPVLAKTKAEDRERLRNGLAQFDLQTVARVSGVEASTLERLARDIRAAGRIVFPAGTGLSFGPDGLMGEWLRWALLILTDSLEEPGGMWFDPGWQFKLDEQQTWSPAPEEGSTPSTPQTRPDLPRYFGQTPLAALADEIERGPLRTLIVFGANPITSVPDPDRTTRALQSLEAMAVIDVVPSELTEVATHVLPSTGMLERAEVNGLLTQPYHVSFSPPVVKPVAERRHSWYMILQLAKRLGVLDKVAAGLDIDTVTEEEIVRRFVATARHSYEELRDAGPHGVTYNTRKRWALERAVPEGKWRVAPAVLVERLSSLLAAKTDETFPLRLICGRQERRHNRHSNVELQRHADLPLLKISEVDAAHYGIADGAYVRVRSAHGELMIRATVESKIRKGVVQLPHAWPEANVTRLFTTVDVDPLTTQPQMTAMAVSIEPVNRSD